MRGSMAASTLVCCLLASVLAGGPAAPEYKRPDHAKLKALLPPGPDAASCYARSYTSEDDATLIATDNGGTEKQYFRYDFTLAAKVKDGSQTLYASGDCASAEAIGCGVDCDGGSIDIEPVAGTDGSILVRLKRIRMTLGCNEGPDIDLEGGADDKLFKLTRAPRKLCQAMQAAEK